MNNDNPFILRRSAENKFIVPNPRRKEYEELLRQRQAEGRYTLEEAADAIAKAAKTSPADILKKLMQAVRLGKLQVYEPGSQASYNPEQVKKNYEEAYSDDLNLWLRKYEPRIKFEFQFPKPFGTTENNGNGNEAAPDHWTVKAKKIADDLAQDRWNRGERQITARNIAAAVTTELKSDHTTHGKLGERGVDNVRTEGLRGWKFTPKPGK